jgi:hypothetical protein
MSEGRTPHSSGLQPHHAFAELATIRSGVDPLDQVLQQVASLATRTIPGVEEASVTLVEDPHPRTAATTGPLAAELDERQYRAGFGPCVDASLSGQTILIDSHDDHSPYPFLTEACRRHGVRYVLSAGLPATQGLVGALNLYSRDEQPVDNASIALAQAFVGVTAAAAANAALHHSTVRLVDQLRNAMASRAVIEQAKGLIMGQLHCSPQDAFDVLVRASQHENLKLREIAAALVAASQGDSQAGPPLW